MAQPQPPHAASHSLDAKGKDAGRGKYPKLPTPGGPIMPKKQGYVNPGPTPNLRGVEPNTAFHKGEPNPEQSGTPGKHGDHNPGKGASGDPHGHGVPTPIVHPAGRHSDVSAKINTHGPETTWK